MKKYYLSVDFNQNFEQVVHDEFCLYLPDESESIYLGFFDDCKIALQKSRSVGKKTNGCFWCCKKIHNLMEV
jgi:hypothetical protein